MMNAAFYLFSGVFLSLLLSGPVQASVQGNSDATDERTRWRLASTRFDNDLFVSNGEDGNYSAGFELQWQRPRQEGDVRQWRTLGHRIYTAADITSEAVQVDDRPWAGYLFGRLSFERQDRLRSTRLNVEVGLTGPASGGEDLQRAVHKWTGSTAPMGWSDQLPNELTVNLGVQRTHRNPLTVRFAGRAADGDFAYYWGGEAGTVRTQAFVGATLRVGRNLAHFRDIGGLPSSERGLSGRYAYLDYRIEWVAHNLFLDGSLIQNSPRIDSRSVVRRSTAGFHWQLRPRYALNVKAVWISPEFDGPNQRSTQYGAVELVYHFD